MLFSIFVCSMVKSICSEIYYHTGDLSNHARKIQAPLITDNRNDEKCVRTDKVISRMSGGGRTRKRSVTLDDAVTIDAGTRGT